MSPPKTSTNAHTEILIAQDSPTQTEQLKHALECRGYAVTVTANGKEALEAARTRRPTLIVSDIAMPEMDGYALCKRLKTDKELKDVPVILMASLSGTEDVVKGLECGADMFIRKPYDEAAFLSRIDYALSNHTYRESAKMDESLQIKLGDNIHHITSEPQQILDLLISTYEDATRINRELGEKQMDLTRLAAELEREVDERTAALRAEIAEHKMAGEQLRQSEEQYRVVTESISDLIAVLDLEGKRLYNSPSYKDVLGDPIALLGSDSFNEIHPDDRERIRQIFQETVRTGRGQRSEYRFLPRDGTIRYIESEGSVIPDAEGKTAKVVVVSRNITERKRVEEALRASEEKYRSLVSNIPDVSWTLDAKRRFVFVSSNIERVSGYSPSEVYQDGAHLYLSSLHPDDVSKVNESFRALFAEGRPFDVEVRARRKDGEWRWVQHRALATYEKNGIRYADGLLSDVTERKRVEEALRQSEARLREALLAAQMGVWNWMVSTDTITWDENLYSIAGRDPKLPAPGSQEHPKIFAPESWERLKAAVENALATGTPYELDLDLIRPDGSKRWLISRGEPLRDASGRITQLRGTVQDISERKQAEQALSRRAAFDELMTKILGRFTSCAWSEVDSSIVNALHAVAEFIGVDHAYVIMLSADGTTWSGTHEWCGPNVPPRLPDYQNIRLGTQPWSERQLLAGEIIRLNSPDDLPPEAVAERQHYEAEGTFSALDVPIKAAAGVIKGCVGFHSNARPIAWSDTDVSHVSMLGDAIASVIERKRTEEALLRSEAELREAHRIAQVGIWTWEVAPDTVTWSEEIYRIFGRDPTLPAPSVAESAELFTPESWARLRTAQQATLERGTPYLLDLEVVRADGTRGWMIARGEAERDGRGRVTKLRGTTQDITDRKNAEQALARRTQELERSNADLAQFAYVASHDLKEPLRAVSGYVGLLQRHYEGKLDDLAGVCIAHAVDGALRMESLIDGLLAYSRIDARGGEFEAVECEKVLDRALQNLAVAIEESSAVVTQGPLPAVNGDFSQLVSVFLNLIGNALKFRKEEPPRIHVSAERSGTHWHFSVRDNGIGIAPQYFERIFGVFQRLHTRNEYPGTGIGLAICKKIVERHGGRIWVESVPGEGTTFYFSLADA